MVFFKRSKSEDLPKPQAKRRFIPSLNLKFLRWKSKTLNSVESTAPPATLDSNTVERPVSRAASLNSVHQSASLAVTDHVDMDMPSSHSISSASSSIYSDQDQASIVSMPSLATDDTSPPDSPIDSTPQRRPLTALFERPATSYESSPAMRFPLLKRQTSVYSHRSLNIQRDSIRPPTALPSTLERPKEPTIAEDHCLILTMTSKYPTGIAAELYVPEDLSYDVVMRKQKEARRAHLRETFNRKSDLFRRNSTVRSSDDKDLEKKRAKRMSINF